MSMIAITGNLVFDAESKTAGGASLTKMRIASNERVKDESGNWKDGNTTFLNVVCWRKLADVAANLKKGDRVIVYGKLKGREFDRKDGTRGYDYELDATDIGTSLFNRNAVSTNNTTISPDTDNPWG